MMQNTWTKLAVVSLLGIVILLGGLWLMNQFFGYGNGYNQMNMMGYGYGNGMYGMANMNMRGTMPMNNGGGMGMGMMGGGGMGMMNGMMGGMMGGMH